MPNANIHVSPSLAILYMGTYVVKADNGRVTFLAGLRKAADTIVRHRMHTRWYEKKGYQRDSSGIQYKGHFLHALADGQGNPFSPDMPWEDVARQANLDGITSSYLIISDSISDREAGGTQVVIGTTYLDAAPLLDDIIRKDIARAAKNPKRLNLDSWNRMSLGEVAKQLMDKERRLAFVGDGYRFLIKQPA